MTNLQCYWWTGKQFKPAYWLESVRRNREGQLRSRIKFWDGSTRVVLASDLKFRQCDGVTLAGQNKIDCRANLE